MWTDTVTIKRFIKTPNWINPVNCSYCNSSHIVMSVYSSHPFRNSSIVITTVSKIISKIVGHTFPQYPKPMFVTEIVVVSGNVRTTRCSTGREIRTRTVRTLVRNKQCVARCKSLRNTLRYYWTPDRLVF